MGLFNRLMVPESSIALERSSGSTILKSKIPVARTPNAWPKAIIPRSNQSLSEHHGATNLNHRMTKR